MRDSNSTLLGTLLDPNFDVLTRINGSLIVLQSALLPDGSGFQTNFPITFIHTTPDCSGTRYLQVLGGVLLPTARIALGAGLRPLAYGVVYPTSTLTAGSIEQFNPGQDTSQPGSCTVSSQTVPNVGATTTVDLSAFVPPFSLQ